MHSGTGGNPDKICASAIFHLSRSPHLRKLSAVSLFLVCLVFLLSADSRPQTPAEAAQAASPQPAQTGDQTPPSPSQGPAPASPQSSKKPPPPPAQTMQPRPPHPPLNFLTPT